MKKGLDLSSRGLTSLPENIGERMELEALDLYNNQLTSLPESIWQLTRLERLNVADNQLSSMSEYRKVGQCSDAEFGPQSVGSYSQLDWKSKRAFLPLSKLDFIHLNYKKQGKLRNTLDQE